MKYIYKLQVIYEKIDVKFLDTEESEFLLFNAFLSLDILLV